MRKKYVYDVKCADFLIHNGALCIGTGINRNSLNTFWVFNYIQCQDAYKKWNREQLLNDILKEIWDNHEKNNAQNCYKPE